MACFLVGTGEAVVVTMIAKAVKKQEEKKAAEIKATEGMGAAAAIEQKQGIPWSRKLMWLAYLLFGGALLLAYEHVWHGEVVPWFPFLTAMSDPEDTAEMLHEMSTIGVTMACIVTAVWAGICVAADAIVKRVDTFHPTATL